MSASGDMYKELGRAISKANDRAKAQGAARRRAEALAEARELERLRGEQARLKAECAERRQSRERAA
jgi:hypothetical protein